MLQKSNSEQTHAESARTSDSFFQRGTQFLGAEWNVIYALMVREMKTRFGRYKLGYFWAIFEPLSYIGALSVVRLAFGDEKMGGIPFPLFFTMGIIPFMVFNNVVNQSITTVEANQGLFIYRRIRPFHCVVSRILLEFCIYLVSVTLILIGFQLAGLKFSLGHWWLTLLLTLFFLGFCIGIGLMMTVVGPIFSESQKIIPIFIRPLFFISGVFIPAVAIPEPYFSWVYPNPLLHFIELYRVTLFADYEAPFRSLLYVWMYSSLLLALGILIYITQERKLLTSGTIKLR